MGGSNRDILKQIVENNNSTKSKTKCYLEACSSQKVQKVLSLTLKSHFCTLPQLFPSQPTRKP